MSQLRDEGAERRAFVGPADVPENSVVRFSIPGLDQPGIIGDQLELMAHAVNTLSGFLGRRDLPTLDRAGLATLDLKRADVLILFGGSIIAGADLLAQAIRRGLAKRYLIVGGRGHTTGLLRRAVAQHVPSLVAGRTEADLFAQYLLFVHGLEVDLLERRSTNCGSNVANCLDLLRSFAIPHGSIVAIQDAAMQRRIDAGFARHLPSEHRLINYAAYSTTVVAGKGRLEFADPPVGMWAMSQFVSLLLGEIPRLTDNSTGYGPIGRGFIAHVEIPERVSDAYRYLSGRFPTLVRQTHDRWATAT